MEHSQLVDAVTNSFLSPTLPNQPGKSSYGSIQDNHRLLTANVVSIKSPCGRGQNGHLGIVVTATQYALVCQVPFVCLTENGCTPKFPLCKTSFDKKALLCKNTKQRQQYNKCCNVNAALHNQILTAFDNT